MKKRTLLLTFLLFFLLSPLLFSAVVASYMPASPLYLQPYQKLHLALYGDGSGGDFPNKMAIYLGRFNIDTQGEIVTNFRIISPISTAHISFIGPIVGNPSYDVYFYPIAQLVYNNGGTLAPFTDVYHANGVNPIKPSNTPMQGIVTIDVFLVAKYYPNVDFFTPGGTFTHNRGTFGTFSLGYSTSSQGEWSETYSPVVGENGEPLSELPVLAAGTNDPDEPIQYEDPEPIACQFSIQEMPGDFPIYNAVGANAALVAKAELTVLNLGAVTTHQVDLTFTNAEQSSQFALKQTNGDPPHTIPYSLLFGSTPIFAGDTTRWEGLINGTQYKDIFITGIDQQDAETALAGTYQDTIYVQITPVDTI